MSSSLRGDGGASVELLSLRRAAGEARERRRGLAAAATEAEEALARMVAHARGVAEEARR